MENLTKPERLFMSEQVLRTVEDAIMIADGNWQHFQPPYQTVADPEQYLKGQRDYLLGWLCSPCFIEYCELLGLPHEDVQHRIVSLLSGKHNREEIKALLRWKPKRGRKGEGNATKNKGIRKDGTIIYVPTGCELRAIASARSKRPARIKSAP